MQYVVVLEMPDIDEGDDSIEAVCREMNQHLEYVFYYEDKGIPVVRPLSEVLAC